jgi:uncharacterized damage-inducible protein DinB
VDEKQILHHYLSSGRDALVWKLEGLGEYDLRRPLVPTGTNLLGLVKHVASVEYGYFGIAFDRPPPDPLPWWDDDAEPNADMWATPDESREAVLGLYERARAHADATIEALPLDAVGSVPWWSEGRRETDLQTLLVHVVAETHRHAGHADLVRELIDGTAGLRASATNLPDVDDDWWTRYRERLEQSAREAERRWT